MRSTAPSAGCASPPRTRCTATALPPPRTCRPRTAGMRPHWRRCSCRPRIACSSTGRPPAGAGLRRTLRRTPALFSAASCRRRTASTTFGRGPAGMPPAHKARMRCWRPDLGTPRWRSPRTMQRRPRSTGPPCSSCTAQSQARCTALKRRGHTATALPPARTYHPRTACMHPHWRHCSCLQDTPRTTPIRPPAGVCPRGTLCNMPCRVPSTGPWRSLCTRCC